MEMQHVDTKIVDEKEEEMRKRRIARDGELERREKMRWMKKRSTSWMETAGNRI